MPVILPLLPLACPHRVAELRVETVGQLVDAGGNLVKMHWLLPAIPLDHVKAHHAGGAQAGEGHSGRLLLGNAAAAADGLQFGCLRAARGLQLRHADPLREAQRLPALSAVLHPAIMTIGNAQSADVHHVCIMFQLQKQLMCC